MAHFGAKFIGVHDRTTIFNHVGSGSIKHCLIDPLPTWLLKNNVDLLAPFLRQLFNWSPEHGAVPSSMKAAYITPIVKKANMIPSHTGPSLTSLLYPSCWKDYSASSLCLILKQTVYCLICNLRFVRITPLKQPCSK